VAEIFLKEGDALIRMREAPYDTEAILQRLIARHPQMLAGDDSDDPAGSWLLVRREAAVYDEGDAASRGSVDHLFIDAEAIPTLVEVKRSTDTRIRREVVGQMLDYAANAAHWTVDTFRAWLEARCTAEGVDVEEVLSAHTDDAVEFWEKVRANLAAGRLRLVFVADEVPPELRRVVEFLNGQMTECEVIAIEVRQYLDGARQQTVIVPRAVGQTEAAKLVKGKRRWRHWNRNEFLEDLHARCSSAAVRAATDILEWGDGQSALTCSYGHGIVDGSVQFGTLDGERRIFPFVVYTNGAVEIPFARMAEYRPFADDALREQYRQKMNAIEGVDLALDAIQKRPSTNLETLADEQALGEFLAAADWALSRE
jgi:hypothetical protein